MPDEESPDNVLQIRPGRPPQPPAPPTFTPAAEATAEGPGHIRTSAFDAPPVPVAPDLVPATFRAEGPHDPHGPGGDAGPPRTGALSMAAVLAIALAAFEGLRTWIQEAGPRRAQAAAHQREIELLAAKADADATRYAAQAGHERAKAAGLRGRVPSGHEYGRSALSSRSGGSGRGGGPAGLGGARKAPSGLGSGPHGGRAGSSAGGPLAGRGPSRSSGGGSSRLGGGWPPGSKSGSGAGKPRAGTGSSGGRGGKNPAAGKGLSDWWQRRTGKNGSGPGSAGTGTGSGDGGGRGPDAKPGAAGASSRSRRGLKEAAQQAMQDRWNSRSHLHPFKPKPKPGGKGGLGPTNPPPGNGPTGGSTGTGTASSGGGRTTFWQAVGETAQARWNKRRAAGHHTRRNDGPHAGPETPGHPAGGSAHRGGPGAKPGGGSAKPGGPGAKRPGPGAKPGAAGPEDGAGFTWRPRSSPWDEAGAEEPVTVTVERADGGPGANSSRPGAKPRSSSPPGVTTGKRALPRAPQRPAGKRPGTSRRKDPIAMEPIPRTTVGAPARMAPEHATEVNLDQSLHRLHVLVNEGMETHDDCAALVAAARKLLGAMDDFAKDLAGAHNVTDRRLHQELAQTVEIVANLLQLARQMSKDALAAAELAETCEYGMNRDYRPISNATAEAGLYTPSAAVHNEN